MLLGFPDIKSDQGGGEDIEDIETSKLVQEMNRNDTHIRLSVNRKIFVICK